MKNILKLSALLLFLLTLSGCGQMVIGGNQVLGGRQIIGAQIVAPVISGILTNVTATTIKVAFTTQAPASTLLSCNGVAQVAPGAETGSLAHQAGVSGLNPGTAYTCAYSSSNAAGSASGTFTATTAALPASTPITGVTYGTASAINALNGGCQMDGDTFYNAITAAGINLYTTDDTSGYSSGCGGITNTGSDMQLDAFSGTFPSTGHTVNALTGYGPSTHTVGPDNLSPKDSGLWTQNNEVFMLTGRQLNGGSGGTRYTGGPFLQSHGEMMKSLDGGLTWDTWEQPNVYSGAGIPTQTAMFGTVAPLFASATFVMYGADDGSIGLLNPANQVDNADLWNYLVSNEGCWQNCSNYYIARVPRQLMDRLNPADYQYFTGGACNADASWSANKSAATPIVSAVNQLSEPNVQYVAALNRYLMLGYYYPSVGYTRSTQWPVWESPSPCGPWTKIADTLTDSMLPGAYNPVIVQSTVLGGTAPYIVFTGDFNGSNYNMWYSRMTINH